MDLAGRLWVLFLAFCGFGVTPGTSSTVCSSLHGPFCPAINGQAPPRRVQDTEWASAAGDGEHDGLVSSLKSWMSKMAPRRVTGKFHVRGKFKPHDRGGTGGGGSILLMPGKWIGKAPEGWLTVGLRGELAVRKAKARARARANANAKPGQGQGEYEHVLRLYIVDGEGHPMEMCDPMELRRPKPKPSSSTATFIW